MKRTLQNGLLPQLRWNPTPVSRSIGAAPRPTATMRHHRRQEEGDEDAGQEQAIRASNIDAQECHQHHGCLDEVGCGRKPARQMRRRAKPLLQDDSLSAKSRPLPSATQLNRIFRWIRCPSASGRASGCRGRRRPPVLIGPMRSKWDGYRLAIHIEPKGAGIIIRGGQDWTHCFPAIATAVKELGVATAILDGEAVVLNEEGRPDFGRCSAGSAEEGASAFRRSPFSSPLTFYFDGHDWLGPNRQFAVIS